MICGAHSDRQAVALCVNCGIGMCGSCAQKSARGKYVCSGECAHAANLTDEAMAALTSRTQRSAKATAWFCWLLGGLCAPLGALALFGEDKFLAVYLLGASAVFLFVGTWYGRIAAKASNTKAA
jgi:hypothetical protein